MQSMIEKFLLPADSDNLARVGLDSQKDDALGSYIQVSACFIPSSIPHFSLGDFVMQLAYHSYFFMRSSVSIESWVTGVVHRADEAEKLAFEVERRALEAKHEALRAHRVHTEVVEEEKHLGRISREAEG